MRHILSSRRKIVFLLTQFVAGPIILFPSLAARSMEPDIPKIQSEAERGSIQEQIELAAAYFVGRGVNQDKKLAAYWYEKAANAGDPAAENQIGYFYEVGIGVPKDLTRAVRWYERASASGFAGAKVNLGVVYLFGLGVRKDEGLAAQLFKEAVKKGSGLGACYLGDMYYLGAGVQVDKTEAQHWYEAGVKLRDPHAQFRLGLMLSSDRSRGKDFKRAATLLRESGNAGLIQAKHQLGLLLVQSPQLANSPDEAVSLLKEASVAGSWKSSVALGVITREGKGVPVNAEEAYYHFRVATLQGGETADRLVANDLNTLSAKLGVEKAKELDQEAAAWYQIHPLSLELVFKAGESWKDFPGYALQSPQGNAHAGRIIATSQIEDQD